MKKQYKSIAALIAFTALFLTPVFVNADIMEKTQIHGFVSQGYLYTGDNQFLADTESGSVEFNEAGISFSIEPIERLRIGLQLFSRDLGEMDNNRIDLDWAFADYRLADELGVRVGRFKNPIGLHHDSIDLDMVRTSIFLPLGSYEIRRRTIMISTNGMGVYGNVNIGPMGSLEYNASMGTNSIEKEGIELLYEGLMDVEKVSMDMLYNFRLIWNTPLKGLLFGGSYLIVENFKVSGELVSELTAPIPELGGRSIYPAGTKVEIDLNKIELMYLFTQYTMKKLTFTAELDIIKTDADINTSNPFDPLVGSLIGFSGIENTITDEGGWYGQINYQFLDWLTAGVTYGEFYADWDDRDGEDFNPHHIAYQKDTTLSLRFDINSHWNVKMETHFMNGTGLLSTAGAPRDADAEENWILYAAKTSFYF